MIFLVLEESPGIRDSLCFTLLSCGIKGVPVSSYDEALQAFKTLSAIDGAIIDIDNKELKGTELIKELKEREDTKAVSIILHTIQSNKEFVVKMVEFGIIGYLLKPFDEEKTSSKLKSLLDKNKGHTENNSRKHIRVKPEPDELLRLHFKLRDHPSMISGKILDISMGGVAIEMFNPPPEGVLPAGKQIAKIEFTLSGSSLSISGVVILLKAKFLALRFGSLSSGNKNALARYIFKRISD